MKMRRFVEGSLTLGLWMLWFLSGTDVALRMVQFEEQREHLMNQLEFVASTSALSVVLFLFVYFLCRKFPNVKKSTKQAEASCETRETELCGEVLGWESSQLREAKTTRSLSVRFAKDDLISVARASLPLWIAVLLSMVGLEDARAACGDEGIFSSRSVLEMKMQGHFKKIYEDNLGGTWPGDESGREPTYFPARLEVPSLGETVEAEARGRGASSAGQGEGDFHKLKVKIKKKTAKQTRAFCEAPEFRINTHVSTHPTTLLTPMGRLNNENAPYREALAYDLARDLGFEGPRLRRARIAYENLDGGEKFTRMAMLLETDKAVAERVGMREVELNDFVSEKDTRIRDEDSALLHLFQTMIGNDDFILRVRQEEPQAHHPDWDYSNVVLLEDQNGDRFPFPYDFDLSTFMAGEVQLEKEKYAQPAFGLKSDPAGRLMMMVASLRARHSRDSVLAALSKMVGARSRLEKTVAEAEVDAEGRAIAQRHLRRFFAQIQEALEAPVTAVPYVRLFEDSALKSEKLKMRSGTPIKILGRTKTALKVAIVDYRLDLDEGEDSVGFIAKDAPIAAWVQDDSIGFIDERDQSE